MNPKVSVIIPAYNTEAYIGEAIKSALEQTLHDIEVIVVDDASSDKTVEIAKSFIDKRLKVIVNQQNVGAAAARNRALRAAQGEWIAVLDSDDWYAPERLEKLVSLADEKNADMIADDIYLINDGETSPWSTLIQESGEVIEKIFQVDIVYFVETDIFGQPGLHLGLSKPLFKREFLLQHGIEYDEDIRMGQDYWLDMKCLIKGARFFLEPKPYYFYRSRPGSLVHQSRLPRLNQSCKATNSFMQQEAVKKNTALMSALSHSLAVYKKNLAYFQVVEPLKQGKWLTALTQMTKNPEFFSYFISRINNIIERRVQYLMTRDKSVFHMSYNTQKKRKTTN
ncbi:MULTISPECIES: glycosyltransferase family 2 protein [Nostoc]|uniref:Glycosyltransferase family 2 protein n=1 Tax=Nostoc punctiforme FACHB-252 TaxID=1357509 RepID=A0ABR8H772_NOSPU|nr:MULTISPECIES: glycosyltransferase family 2 protein [Nostoc]MBC1236410.1 glycosyltransferase family 2 protein [Nostoc sp. 2RC]MBD2611657.1 glycosyltransferase family 2 protein [Nostoc punctiforme FACHB-252]MBL1202577.1 glycosyltransferase family 2 protein [Nostoc sp. GBBB01]MDZ8010662.1 glycosyltransferase family 2 protein [Nostoc sp. ZfuVER08]